MPIYDLELTGRGFKCVFSRYIYTQNYLFFFVTRHAPTTQTATRQLGVKFGQHMVNIFSHPPSPSLRIQSTAAQCLKHLHRALLGRGQIPDPQRTAREAIVRILAACVNGSVALRHVLTRHSLEMLLGGRDERPAQIALLTLIEVTNRLREIFVGLQNIARG